MKKSILPAVLILYFCLWSIGIPRSFEASGTPEKSGSDSDNFTSCSKSGIMTGVFYIDNFLSLPHPDETLLEYGCTVKTRSLKQVHHIWTKGIKAPVTKEYEYLINLSSNLSESLGIDSFLKKAFQFPVKLARQLLGSC